jgi:DNA-binding transcriptional regulator LsrR (DeoR family)
MQKQLKQLNDVPQILEQRDISINAAHMSHGYTLKEIADYLRIYYTTVSKAIAKAAVSKK